MAVLKAKPDKFLAYLFPLLERELLTPLLTTRVASDTFVGAKGDTVTMRVGGLRTVARKYEWRTRTAPIVLDDIEGGDGIPITFGTHTYSATGLTDENFTMDEVDLVSEVLQPQVEAVAANLEADVVAAYNALAFRQTVAFTEGSTNPELGDPYFVALNAQAALDGMRRAPRNGRVWLCGSNVARAILKSDRITRYDSAGPDNSSALRDATILQIAGLPVVVSRDFEPNFSVVTHQSSLVLATVAPRAPRGATFSQAASANSFGMRWLMDYDPNFLQDRSIVSMFSGITPIYDEIFLTGSKKGELMTPDDYSHADAAHSPATARAVKVVFTPKS